MAREKAEGRTPEKSIGRRRASGKPAGEAGARAADGAVAPTRGTSDVAGPPRGKGGRPALDGELSALVERLAQHTGLGPREVLSRALQSYAAAVAPSLPSAARESSRRAAGSGLPLPSVRAPRAVEAGPRLQRLFVSVDGKPEMRVDLDASRDAFVIGTAADCDLRLELPLVSPHHARILWRDGGWLFEDLKSTRGCFRNGEQLDVRFLEDGDEIDLAGFLSLRFRLEAV
jgi:hypothetical protein